MADEESEREGQNLLGSPTFKELDNGRFKCVETGHELPAKEIELYSQSKRCRLGLIDAALAKKKPPVNLFKQDKLSRSKLVCKLTGDTINKSEEHIWKHINGKRFLNKLEQLEEGKVPSSKETVDKGESKSSDKKKNKKKKKKKKNSEKENKEKMTMDISSEVTEASDIDMDDDEEEDIVKGKKKKKSKKEKKKLKELIEINSEVNEEAAMDDDDDEEEDFWMPPEGCRWDFDDGGDRWSSGSESDQESDEDAVDEIGATDSVEISKGTKRTAVEVGPSSCVSAKKKIKANSGNL